MVCPTGLGFDRDLARLALCRWRQRDLYVEHTVFELRLGFLRIHAFRQRNHAIEPAVAAFGTIVALPLFFVLAFALASDGEPFAGYLDSDVILVHPRQFSGNNQVVIAFEDLHRRHPRASLVAETAPRGQPQAGCESAVHFIGKPAHQRKWIHPKLPFAAAAERAAALVALLHLLSR